MNGGEKEMVATNVTGTQLRLKFETGHHPTSGEVTYKTKSFNNVQPSATPGNLLTVANALASLQTLPLAGVERFDKSEIYEQQ